MLPKEYFGSFDMVLVDLSETVTSQLVTEGLDIMDALGLLLKPDGIMVKNEMYFEQMSEIFDYTILAHYHDVPFICSQALIMGSNGNNFLEAGNTNHGVDSLFYRIHNSTEDNHEIIHDYQKSSGSAQKHCKQEGEGGGGKLGEQVRSPGILVVLEIEDVGDGLLDEEMIDELVSKAAADAGLARISSKLGVGSKSKHVAVATALKEGYIMARAWPDHKYCAFDLHLWSSFEKQEVLEEALLKNFRSSGSASGSKLKSNPSSSTTSSSFRIVAGGMFGVDTWKEDQMNRGPWSSIEGFCSTSEVPKQGAPVGEGDVNAIIGESVRSLLVEQSIVAVLCDSEKGKRCGTLDSLNSNNKVSQVIVLRACPGSSGDDINKMKTCEENVRKTLMGALGEDKRLSAIVLDPSAPIEIAQIFHKIVSEEGEAKGLDALLDENARLLGHIPAGSAESWKKHFLVRFHNDLFVTEPAYIGQIQIQLEGAGSVGVVARSDVHFTSKLRQVAADIETRTGATAEVTYLHGGFWKFHDPFVPTDFFLPEAYDQTSPLEQWNSQQPVALQVVMQFERSASVLSASEVEEALAASAIGRNLISFDVPGDGALHVAHWEGGSAVILWDGRSHVDINLFTLEEDFDLALKTSSDFQSSIRGLKEVLKDEHPRGFGRVVNFRSDIEPRIKPHWA